MFPKSLLYISGNWFNPRIKTHIKDIKNIIITDTPNIPLSNVFPYVDIKIIQNTTNIKNKILPIEEILEKLLKKLLDFASLAIGALFWNVKRRIKYKRANVAIAIVIFTE